MLSHSSKLPSSRSTAFCSLSNHQAIMCWWRSLRHPQSNLLPTLSFESFIHCPSLLSTRLQELMRRIFYIYLRRWYIHYSSPKGKHAARIARLAINNWTVVWRPRTCTWPSTSHPTMTSNPFSSHPPHYNHFLDFIAIAPLVYYVRSFKKQLRGPWNPFMTGRSS